MRRSSCDILFPGGGRTGQKERNARDMSSTSSCHSEDALKSILCGGALKLDSWSENPTTTSPLRKCVAQGKRSRVENKEDGDWVARVVGWHEMSIQPIHLLFPLCCCSSSSLSASPPWVVVAGVDYGARGRVGIYQQHTWCKDGNILMVVLLFRTAEKQPHREGEQE